MVKSFKLFFEEFRHYDWGSVHHADVAGHQVRIGFSRRGTRDDGRTHFGVSYNVDGSMSRGNISPEHGKHVLHHVGKVVDAFIKDRKPAALSMSGSDSDMHTGIKKQKMYMHLANRLAKKHGGKTDSSFWQSTVHFEDA